MQKCILMAALLGLSISLGSDRHTAAADVRYSGPIQASEDIPVGNTINAPTQDPAPPTRRREVARSQYTARVSWYRHGKVTANGERFNPQNLTVAHKSLPFNTMVRFTDPETGRSIVARVNDRGPYIRGRDFDLSMGSAQLLGIYRRGVALLNVEILKEKNDG